MTKTTSEWSVLPHVFDNDIQTMKCRVYTEAIRSFSNNENGRWGEGGGGMKKNEKKCAGLREPLAFSGQGLIRAATTRLLYGKAAPSWQKALEKVDLSVTALYSQLGAALLIYFGGVLIFLFCFAMHILVGLLFINMHPSITKVFFSLSFIPILKAKCEKEKKKSTACVYIFAISPIPGLMLSFTLKHSYKNIRIPRMF